jgi:starvation-inducible DNA-binding protein
MKTSIGIKDADLKKVAKLLNVLLADEHIIYMKTRNAHWNVEGAIFMLLTYFWNHNTMN